MDLEPNEEQRALAESVRRLLNREHDVATRRALQEDALGWSEKVWRALADMGVLGLGIAEEHGGSGGGAAEIAVVAQELGRALAPEPWLDAVVAPGLLLGSAAASSPTCARMLADVASGEILVSSVVDRDGALRMTAVAATERVSLGGFLEDVANAHRAEAILMVDLSRRVVLLIETDQPGVQVEVFSTRDGRRGGDVVLRDADARVVAEGSEIISAIERGQATVAVARCARAVGAMQGAVSITADYLDTRHQFGRPLRDFQALTHRLADLHVETVLAESLVMYAAGCLASGVGDGTEAERALATTSRAARYVGEAIVQMHGGIAVTDEHAAGQYFRALTAYSIDGGTMVNWLLALASTSDGATVRTIL